MRTYKRTMRHEKQHKHTKYMKIPHQLEKHSKTIDMCIITECMLPFCKRTNVASIFLRETDKIIVHYCYYYYHYYYCAVCFVKWMNPCIVFVWRVDCVQRHRRRGNSAYQIILYGSNKHIDSMQRLNLIEKKIIENA